MPCSKVCLNVLCLFVPWLAVAIDRGGCEGKTLLCLVLWIIGWLPGVIYGYVVLNAPKLEHSYQKVSSIDENQNAGTNKNRKRRKKQSSKDKEQNSHV